MDYKDDLARVVEYIEQNLTQEIDLATCARVCGYSEYHFLRVFKAVTGLTPADYIRKRRLSEIAKRVCSLDGPISEPAYAYGFNSQENFTRAFKSEHGILPTEYKTAQNSLKLYEPVSFSGQPFLLIPQIMIIPDFSLTVFKSHEDTPPQFWNKYNARKLSLRLSGGKICEDFGVSLWNWGENRLDYCIGIHTDQAIGDVSGTQELQMAGGLYAIFQTPRSTHEDFVNTIHRTWEFIHAEWWPQCNYRPTDRPSFESYIEASRTYSEKIYIPVAEELEGVCTDRGCQE